MLRYILFIYLSFSFVASARAPKEFSLRRTEIVMQTEGIKFKPFRDMVAEPIQPLRGTFFTSRSSSLSETEKVHVYHKKELWRLDNVIATYKNPRITLQILKINYVIPDGMRTYGRDYVEKPVFQKHIKPIAANNH